MILVLGHKYPKMKGDHLYGGTGTHGCFAIYFFNPCFRVLMAWGKYIEIPLELFKQQIRTSV